MQKLDVEESWNKKRIFVAFIITMIALATGGYLLKTYVLGKNIDFFRKKTVVSPTPPKDVKGASAQEGNTGGSDIKLQKTLQGKLDNLKKEVANLNIADIASSSPQVQKIINDLNSLKEYPRSEAKNICQKLCSGL